MIEIAHGNLLTAQVDALVNTVNTEGVMGKGIALQFKRAFPANYNAYRRACSRGEVRLGEMFVFEAGGLDKPRLIVNFPTKGHWRSRTKIEYVEEGLRDLVRVIDRYGVQSIAIPPLGCGNGGLDWRDVRPLIESALEGVAGVHAKLYPPEGAPAATSMPTRTKRPQLSPARAAVIGLLSQYLEPGFGASRLEVQKLLYLLQVMGEPLNLVYVRAQYGPYAEAVNHILEGLEGHYLSGYGDRTRSAPLELLSGSAEAAADFVAHHPTSAARLKAVTELIDGFETPYGLELLSTVHWVTTESSDARSDQRLATKLVQEWSRRKEQLFTDRHVAVAWDRLETTGLLASAEGHALRAEDQTDDLLGGP